MIRLLSLALLCAVASAQSVHGVVVNAATHKPVAGAIVSLFGVASDADREADIYRTHSTASGEFRFDAVARGHYHAVAEARGFLRLSADGGAMVRLAMDSANDLEIKIPLTPACVITGRVSDSDGDPERFVRVEALQYGYTGGKRKLLQRGDERTDDRGEYRIYNLSPGRYFVRATARDGRHVPTLFPDAREAAAATPVEVAAGAEARGIDFTLRAEEIHSIHGKVIDSVTGEAVNGVYVQANLASGDFAQGASPLNGAFLIRNLCPGQYVLTARNFDTEAQKSARLAVDLGSADLSDVTLVLLPGIEVTGSIRGVGADSAKMTLQFAPDNSEDGTSVATVDSAGAFVIHNMRPELYHIYWTLPKGTYVKSIKLGDRVLPDDSVEIAGSRAVLSFQLASDGGHIEGTVRDADGAPLASATVTLNTSPTYDEWIATTDDAGHFELKDIAPGTYTLLAFEGKTDGAEQDAEFRKPFADRATKVEVLPSTRQKVDLVAVKVP